MTLKYDLQRLGGIGFQDVVAALAIKVLGTHVRPMGRGKDGGRDMLVNNGIIVWAANDHYGKVETWGLLHELVTVRVRPPGRRLWS